MSNLTDIFLPDIGDYRDVPVVEIYVKPGDTVAADDPLISIESDKATMEVPAPAAGTVQELMVEIGTRISQGSLIMILASAGEKAAPPTPVPHTLIPTPAPAPAPVEPRAPAPARKPASTAPQQQLVGGSAHATPSVRALACELGVDLASIRPSGPKGRILREDVTAHVKQALASPVAGGELVSPRTCRPGPQSITKNSGRSRGSICRASRRFLAPASPATG
ncbi:e3 binding domain-containing protein [Pseudaminobacter salicylatoxidans]|uniref:Dihydrolipoyllysine-residue acetyltransferase component of pyruvate dehydrogenase complex n=1 Tax=Pseudaminobacter salicylatoxidans TaxID=93369 RepID=A0A316C4Q8_PSESE|nr:e3 binding domain-containing protein [Pseudaminobacter salicylatoxidans]